MAWGTFTCRRHVAADDANWAVFETRMNELIPLALQNTDDAFALYDEIPFDLTKDEFQQYATDKGMRTVRNDQQRAGPSARGDRHRLLTATARGHVRQRGRESLGGLGITATSQRYAHRLTDPVDFGFLGQPLEALGAKAFETQSGPR